MLSIQKMFDLLDFCWIVFLFVSLLLVKNSNLFQIKYVPYIESIREKKDVFYVSFSLYIDKNPLYPVPHMIILLLIYYYLNYLFSLSLYRLSLSLFKKMISIRCLIGHVGFFFSVSLLFSVYFARAILLLHMTEKQPKRNDSSTCCLIIPHTPKHEKNERISFSSIWKGDFKSTSRIIIYAHEIRTWSRDILISNYWIKKKRSNNLKE